MNWDRPKNRRKQSEEVPRWIIEPPTLEVLDDSRSAGPIGRLPRRIRHELNCRLYRHDSNASLLRWLNRLSASKIRSEDIAFWKKHEFPRWRARQAIEDKFAREFRSWVNREEVLDRVFGRPLSQFELQNRIRQIFGMAPLTRKDIPPGEDWDSIPTRAERKQAEREILGLDSSDDEPLPPEPSLS